MSLIELRKRVIIWAWLGFVEEVLVFLSFPNGKDHGEKGNEDCIHCTDKHLSFLGVVVDNHAAAENDKELVEGNTHSHDDVPAHQY